MSSRKARVICFERDGAQSAIDDVRRGAKNEEEEGRLGLERDVAALCCV